MSELATQKRGGAILTLTALLLVACGSNSSAPLASPSGSPNVTLPPATSTQVTAVSATLKATPAAQASRNPSAGYTDLKGWLVFEHFGQAPDGSTPDFDFDNRMIWMAHADGTGLHELAAGKPSDGKSAPDISPDGTTVAFSSWGPHSQLWTAPIDGGDPTLITTGCSGRAGDCLEVEPAWSADGDSLAFAHLAGNAGHPYTDIGIRDVQTGTVRFLSQTRIDFNQGYASEPSWSPDGREIVYYIALQTPSQDRPTGSKLMVAATDGSTVRELPRPVGSAWAADPDWSPDGSSIVFAGIPSRESEGWADFPNHDGISTINPDGSNLRTVCNGCLPSPAGPAGGNAPSWTSDGRILFWGYKTWALMNADGSDAAHINMAKLTWNGDGLGYNYTAVLQPTN